MKFNIRSILLLSALLTFALSWSWVCLDDYLSFRNYYEKLINREKVILENDDLKEFELISKIRQLDLIYDTDLDKIKEVISLDPENSYLQLILLDHMSRSFTGSQYTMQDKIDVLNKFVELKKYDTYRAETIEICSRNIPDGNRKIIVNFLNSVNVGDSIYFVIDFLKDYRKIITDSIIIKDYDKAERLLKQYDGWIDSLFRKVSPYFNL